MNPDPKTRASTHEAVLALCQSLIAIPSGNPPGDTTAMADAVAAYLVHPQISVARHEPKPGTVNLVAVLRGAHPGPRVVLNGHMDTFPVGPREGWIHDPMVGVRDGDRIYGRGTGDMKAGVSVLVHVMLALAERQRELHGELVLTLVGDEESGGKWGTGWLLDNVPESRGDYVLNADAGNPRVVRYGEKGIVWLRVSSKGVACHGAHVHRGDNAVESLMAAVTDLTSLRKLPATLPADVLAAMKAARAVSEQEGGDGEFDNLSSVTVNIGAMHGGEVPNIVPGEAEALVDIRYPPGMEGKAMREKITAILAAHPKVSWSVVAGSETEPGITLPTHPLVETVLRHARRVAAPDAVANMRVGLTDARYFRHAGMPAVVYGPTAVNMGGLNEHVMIEEVIQVFEVHLGVATEFLIPDRPAA